MHRLWIGIATSAGLLVAGTCPSQGGDAGVNPRPGYAPLPHVYGAPHGYRSHSAYGPPPRYALPPYAYGSPPRYGPPSQYSPPRAYAAPPYAYGAPPDYGPHPEYGLPPRTYDPPPYAMPHDPAARFKAWNEIADSLTEALLQIRLASSHDYSQFTSRSATRPR